VKDIVVCDRKGILNGRTRTDLNEAKTQLAAATNPRGLSGGVEDALRKSGCFDRRFRAGIDRGEGVAAHGRQADCFCAGQSDPEIMPEEAAARAWIVATGRSDYPNQINNVLAFPGIFRGALNVRARRINEAMKLAAAHAIADVLRAGN
jgi:malate dehydrogenase (oxaloacetate-decarboxylating)